MTFLELITAVRDEISEPTPGFVSNDEVKRWLNRANYDLADAAGVEQSGATTIQTVAEQETYSLPANFGLAQQVEVVDVNEEISYSQLDPVSIERRVSGTGRPGAYFIHAGSLYLVPIPDAVYTVKLWYYKAGVTLVADGDVPIIPAKFHDLLTLYAISQAKRKGDDPAYATYLSDYVSGRGGMIEHLRQKGQGNRFAQVLDLDPW